MVDALPPYSYEPLRSRDQAKDKLLGLSQLPRIGARRMFEVVADTAISVQGSLNLGANEVWIQGKNSPLYVDFALSNMDGWRTTSNSWGPDHIHSFVDYGRVRYTRLDKEHNRATAHRLKRTDKLALIEELLHGLDHPQLPPPK